MANLLELANKIQSQVAEVQQYLSKSGQPDPSFDGRAEASDFSGIEKIRVSLLNDLGELQDLLLTPRELLQWRFATEYISRQAIDQFGIIDAVPLEGDISYDDLAKATGLPLKWLRKIVRQAITQRVFYEPRPNHVAHTQLSRLLAENEHVRDWQATIANEVWPASTRACDALAKWPGSNKREESGYFLAKGMSFYNSLSADPVRQKRHDNAYAAFSKDPAFSHQHIVDNFDWESLGAGTVVDIGGGVGTISKLLSSVFPQLSFVVQDTPSVLDGRKPADGDNDRITYQIHDFFTPQPVKDADVYFFRRVMMDWTDEQVVGILRNLKPALKLGATVLIIDSSIPEPGTCPLWLERRFRNSDLMGLALANAGARDVGEWEPLITAAGSGFHDVKVTHVQNTEIVLAKAVWRGE